MKSFLKEALVMVAIGLAGLAVGLFLNLLGVLV